MKTISLIVFTLVSAVTACAGQAPVAPPPSASSSLRFGHVALAVRDLSASIHWYADAFGFVAVAPPADLAVDDSPLGRVATALFGRELKRVRIAQLKTPDGIGIELFEFTDPRLPWSSYSSTGGILHFAVVAPSFDSTLARLERLGAHAIVLNDANPTRRVVFISDPDGHIVEIASRSWDGM